MSEPLRFAMTKCVRCQQPVLWDERRDERAGYVWHERCPNSHKDLQSAVTTRKDAPRA